MGHRLSKIYTRTGDAGTTSIGQGKRVAKNDAIIEAMGTVDELNSQIGVLMANIEAQHDLHSLLLDVQHDLFDLGSEFIVPDYQAITNKHIEQLEAQLDSWNEQLQPLKEFILPSGNRAIAQTHVARTVCRRAERRMVDAGDAASSCGMKYLNRLSDWLFVLAREVARREKVDEVYWNNKRREGLKNKA